MAHVTIPDTAPRVQYTVGGTSTTNFTIPFAYFADSDIKVYVGSTLKTLSTDYTITGTTVDEGFSGGTVVLNTGVTNTTVTVLRDVPIKRITDFPTNGPFNITQLNTELDALTAQLQQEETGHDLFLRIAEYDTYTDLTLPVKADRAGTVLGFNATTGDPEAGPTIADVSTLAAITADIATLADIEDGTDATDAIQTVAGIAGNVTTVAGISGNVTTVAGISANVTSVAGNSSNINTVAGINANVTTVAGIAADVTAAANISSDIQDVQDKLAEIQTVADDLNEAVSEIDTVANIASDVETVGGIAANVTTVAGISGNVTTVAGISANVTTVAGVAANVTTVAGISADVTTVAGDSADIQLLADNIGTIGDKVSKAGDTMTGDLILNTTGALTLPVGTEAQRPTPVKGMFRFNDDSDAFEGYDGTEWGAVGGGNTAVVGWENQITVAENYTITSGNNMMSAGPVTIASGVSVTVPTGSRWVVV